MALDVKVGSFATPTSTGTLEVSGLGFEPKALILWAVRKSSDGVGTDDRGMYAVATGPTEELCLSWGIDDGSNTKNKNYAASSVVLIDNSATVLVQGNLTAFDSDGFDLDFVTVEGTAWIVNFIALGGSDVQDALALQIDSPTGTGSQSVTSVGFQGTALIAFGSIVGGLGSGASCQPSIGVATAADEEGWTGGNCQNGTTNAARAQRTDRTFGIPSNTASNYRKLAEFTGFTATGFDLNWTDAGSSSVFNFIVLVLKGPQAKVFSASLSTSMGNQSISGIGFQPSCVALAGYNKETDATPLTTQFDQFFGAATSSTARAAVSQSKAHGGAQTDSGLTRTKCIQHLLYGTPTVETDADFVSFDADGFTINNTTVASPAREVFGLALAGAEAVVATEQDPLERKTNRQDHRGVTILRSQVLAVADAVIMNGIDVARPRCFAGVKFFSDSAGETPASPSAGSVGLKIATVNTHPTFEDVPGGTTSFSASAPETLSWLANTQAVRVDPSGISGATHYQLVVTCNDD